MKLGMKKRIKASLPVVMTVILTMMTGCGNRTSAVVADIEADTVYIEEKNNDAVAERIAAAYQDIYDEAASANTLGSLAVTRRIVDRLGALGYVAIDSENQIDMAGAWQTEAFCEAVDSKKSARMTIIVIEQAGFQKFDLETEDGSVNVVRGYYEYDANGCLQNRNTVSYPADSWQYTPEGYLIFSGNYFSDERYMLTLSDASEHTALRVLPLDETCRELNRRYILPVGYRQNNLFLCDWDETDFGQLDFYDMFDRLYPMVNGQPHSYTAVENPEAVYQVPEDTFESTIMAYFHIDSATLRLKTGYMPESAAYEYRPRGFYETEYPDIPYPEVADYTENPDGTITLLVNAVYPNGDTSRLYAHKTVIRPLNENQFQYVSNQTISLDEDYDIWWHADRLTAEERVWQSEMGEEVSHRFLTQTEQCVISEAEKGELNDMALDAAKQVKEVYRDIELAGESFYGSNIREFTHDQCEQVVRLLGEAGGVAVTEDTNMENYGQLEAFYTAYLEKRDAMVTVFDVKRDGLIGAVTFLYRAGRLQTYYIGICWQEGGVPQIKETLVSDIAEIKLTQKGYFIYAYKETLPHSSLRQYWRVKPLSDKCRELTAKYIEGLSYVNYNVLVTDWDSGNVEDILMPCMFEDIYRMDTGENLKTENWKIPAETFERIMTTYFPVSTEQLRKWCGYDKNSNSYEHEMILASAYPPFGEVVDYSVGADGTITLTVDGVWPDYNSDLAFTNTIVVQPFEDGTFRYLSNSIEEKELEVPVAFCKR